MNWTEAKNHIKNPRERVGLALGYGLGVLTGAISFARHSRMFHPKGITFAATVDVRDPSFSLPPCALLRFSSAWWKNREWIDVLGVAIRFSDCNRFTEEARPQDQDLLLATIRYPWTTPFAPLSTDFHDFLGNEYHAVTIFSIDQKTEKKVKLKLVPMRHSDPGDSREERLKHAVLYGEAGLMLRYLDLEDKKQGWRDLARIDLVKEVKLDQEKLRFDPFQAGAEIHPHGFVHYLRLGAYEASQRMRPRTAQELA